MTIIKYPAPFLAKGRQGKRKNEAAEPPAPRSTRDERRAMQLALAHRIEQAIEAGELSGFADAARRFGLSRSRLSQVMDLCLLPVGEQERLLLG